jgi:hypothetical protein
MINGVKCDRAKIGPLFERAINFPVVTNLSGEITNQRNVSVKHDNLGRVIAPLVAKVPLMPIWKTFQFATGDEITASDYSTINDSLVTFVCLLIFFVMTKFRYNHGQD